MRLYTKVPLIAVVVMTLLPGMAAGRTRLEVRPGGEIVMRAARLTLAASAYSVICDVQLEGQFVLISKSQGSIAASMENDFSTNCGSNIGGSANINFLTAFPSGFCYLRYESIGGTLPTVTGIRLDFECDVLIRIENAIFGRIGCLYRGNAPTSGSNPLTSLTLQTNTYGSLTDLRIGTNRCPATGQLSGQFTITRQTIVLLER